MGNRLLQTLTEESEAADNNTPSSQTAVDVDGTVRRHRLTKEFCQSWLMYRQANNEFDFLLGTDSMSTFGMNLIMPFEMFSEFPVPSNSSQDATPFWMGMS